MIQEYCGVRVSRSLRVVLPVDSIREVLQLQPQEISSIPGVPPFLLGSINQRGNLLWVLHLESFLGIKPTPLSNPLTAVIITAAFDDRTLRSVACVVHQVEEMLSLDTEQLQSIPANLPSRARQIFQGLAQYNAVTRCVLDPIALFQALNPVSVTI